MAADGISLSFQNCGALTSVADYLNDLFRLREQHEGNKFWFRGHSDAAYKLTPTIGRRLSYSDRDVTLDFRREWEFLHRFRRRAYRELGRLLPAGEAIFIARHHGLPTRLLDWTASPLYGLYFACLGEIKKPARLWAMCRVRGFGEYALDSLSLSRVENERTLLAQLDGKDTTYERTAAWNREPRRLKILEPPYNSARLLAQDGVFTVHNCPSVDLEAFAGKTFKAADLDISHFFSWSIPARKKVALLGELNALGITHRSVFPDLDGIARSLWETEVLWGSGPESDSTSA